MQKVFCALVVLAASYTQAADPAGSQRQSQATYLVEFTYSRHSDSGAESVTIARVAILAQEGRTCKITASSRHAMPEEEKDASAYLNAGRTWLANSTLQAVLCHTQESLDDYWTLSKASIKKIDEKSVELAYHCNLNLSTAKFRGGGFQLALKEACKNFEFGKPVRIQLNDEFSADIRVSPLP